VLALRLLLLTFVRTVEMRRAEWSDINLAAAEWRIPPEKMKMRRLHIVPLARQTVELLTELQHITGAGRWLFPNNRRPNDVMAATTVNRALESMGYGTGEVTAHDFRATASTRLHEMGVRSDFIELQLAHVERNRAKAAYNHADHLAERTAMMQAWADWLDGVAAADKARRG
jgi:integrase